MEMNYKKLAELAHVSVSTVSKAFSGSAEISAETREQIFDAARRSGCFDKYFKDKFPKKVIAVLCPEFCSAYYGAYAECIQRLVSERGDVAIFASTNFDKDTEKYLIDYYTLYAKTDGILIVSPCGGQCGNYTMPIVAIGKNEKYSSVNIPTEKGVYDAVSYLAECGHRDIAFAGERLTEVKEIFFKNAMKKLGLRLHDSWIMVSDKRFEKAGEEIARRYLEAEKRPTAVLAGYDNIAIGFISGVRQKGIRVPQDVSVIGMDDISEAAHLEVPLTSVNCCTTEAVESALGMLYKRMNSVVRTTEHIEGRVELKKRGSVKVI